MTSLKKISLLVLLSVILYSCYSDNATTLYPKAAEPGSSTCDTGNVSYAHTIAPILVANCALPSCHAGVSPLGGYVLDNYGGVRSIVVGGRIIGAITHATGYSAMPKDAAMLSDCNIGLIISWIDQGVQNN